jgi:hypothetical protein
MSKNLTRKGLALGAVVALGTSVFAGTPALASAAITVAPSAGTGYTVLASDTFTVKVYGNTDFSFTTGTALKWKVTKPSALASATYTDQASSSRTAASFSTSTVEYIVPSAVSASAGANTLAINPAIASTDASQDWTVQAYVELDGTDGLTAGDLSAPAQTIHFKKGADLTSTLTLDPVTAGAPITGGVKYSAADFNYDQSTKSNTKVVLIQNGTANATHPAVDTVTDAGDGFTFTRASASPVTVAAGDVIGAKTEVVGYDSDSTYTNSAVVSQSASTASDATAAETSYTRGENVKVATAGNSGAITVRTGTKSFSYRVDFKKGSPAKAIAAGKPVSVVITEAGSSNATLVTNDVVRVNGKAVTGSSATAQTATLYTVTDATGGVTLNVESDLGNVGDVITVAVSSNSQTSTQTITWADAALASSSLVDVSKPLASTTRTVVRGGTTTINYELRDQFGKLWTKDGSSYRLSIASSGGSATINQLVTVSNGTASATIVDNSTSAGTYTLTATLQVATTGSYGTDASSAAATSNFNIVSAASTPSTITLGNAVLKNTTSTVVSDSTGAASATIARSDVTAKALDLRSNTNGVGLGVASDNGAKIQGTVKQADGSVAAGVAVTVSATGLFFSTEATGNTYVSANSITLNTDENGAYSAFVFSNKGGTFATTVTAGSATATQSLKFAAAAATAGSVITITAPESSPAGRSVDVTVALTDANGAPVTTSGSSEITVAVTGVGTYTTIADDTDADGLIQFKLVFGTNDIGSAVIKVTYDADDTGTAYDALTVSKTIVVGTTVAAKATAGVSGGTKKFNVSVSNAAGKSVVVKVAGKFVTSFTGSASKKTVAVKATKGSKKVTVYVGGKLVATKTVTVK